MELLLIVPGGPQRRGVPQGIGQKDIGRLGIRRAEARWPGHERSSSLLQPCSPSRRAGGLGRSSAGFLSRNLRNRAGCKTWGPGGVLPLWHGVLLFHHAALQYVGGFRSGKFLSSSLQGENVKGPDGRQRSILRRSRRTER